MTQAIKNYRSQWWVIDTKMANDIFVLFQELAQWVSKVTCYDRLLDILI